MTQLTLFTSATVTPEPVTLANVTNERNTDNWLFATWDKAVEFALKMYETGRYQISIFPFTEDRKIVELVNK